MTINKKIKGFLIHSISVAMHMNIQYSKVFGSSYVYDLDDITTWVYYKNMLGELHDIQKTEKKGYFSPPTIKLDNGEIHLLTKDILNENERLKQEYVEFDALYDSIAKSSNLSLYCKAVAYDIKPEDLDATELTILGYPKDLFSDDSEDIVIGLQKAIYRFGYKWLNTEHIPYNDYYMHFFIASLYSYIHKYILSNKVVRTDGIDASRYMKEVKINSFKYLGEYIYPLNDTSVNWLANNIELLYEYLATDKLLSLMDSKVFRPSGYKIRTLSNVDDSYTLFNNKPVYTNKKHFLIDEDNLNSELITAEEIIHSTENEVTPSMENLLQNNPVLDKRRIPIIDARAGQKLFSRYLMIDRLEYKPSKDLEFVLEYLLYTANKYRYKYTSLDLTVIGLGYRDINYETILANVLAIYSEYGTLSNTIYQKYIIDGYDNMLLGIPEQYHDIVTEAFSKIDTTFDLSNPLPYLSVYNLVEGKSYESDALTQYYINKAIENVRVKSYTIDDIDALIEKGKSNPIISIDIKSLGVLLSAIWNMPNATNEDTDALKSMLEKLVSYSTIVVSKPSVSNIKLDSASYAIVSDLNLVDIVETSKCLGYQTVINKIGALDYNPNPVIVEYDNANIVTDAKINIYTGRYISFAEQPKIIEVR